MSEIAYMTYVSAVDIDYPCKHVWSRDGAYVALETKATEALTPEDHDRAAYALNKILDRD